jgi:hypothetical protein
MEMARKGYPSQTTSSIAPTKRRDGFLERTEAQVEDPATALSKA